MAKKFSSVPATCLMLIVGTSACDGVQRGVAAPTESRDATADIEVFLEGYFSSWSNNDMSEFRSCFHDSAVIVYISDGQVGRARGVDEFIARQSNYLARVKGPVSERMTSLTVNADSQGAIATATWIHEGEGKTSSGVDHFSLVRDGEADWKIVALVWYEDDLSEPN